MRTLCKKALALCLVFALALTCFVGTLSVSAADVSFNANVSVTASPVTLGESDTASAVFHFELEDKTTGINEALIKVSSKIGSVVGLAELVKADGSSYTQDELNQLDYAINYVTTDGQDIAADFSNIANLGAFFLSAKTAESAIKEAFIKVTFSVDANVTAGPYEINIDAPEGKVMAASPSEDIINLIYAGANFTVTEPVTECEHQNAAKTVKEVTETEFIYDLDCPDCDAAEIRVPVNNTEVPDNKVSRTIKPGNDIALWFMFRKEQQVGYTDLCLVIEKEVYEFGANEPNAEHAVYYLTDPIDGNNSSGVLCDTFVFDKLAAYEMGNVVSVKLYGYSSNKEMQLLKTTTYSILQFLTTKINDGGNPNLLKVYVDILNYGAASQSLLDILINTDNLVNSGLTEAQKAYGTPVANYCDTNTSFVDASKSAVYNYESPVGYVTPVSTIAPESKVNIYFKFRVVSKDGAETYFTGDVNNLYCRYYYTDVMGVNHIVDYRYDGLMRDGLNAFKFDLQPIAQLDKAVKAVVYYGDPTDSSSYQIMEKEYSIEAFIKSQISNAGAEVKLVLQTMYAYGYSLKYCIENGLV